MSEPCCNHNGWIVKDGLVVDRCMVCNRPPWLDGNGRPIARVHPETTIGGIIIFLFIIVAIALFA